MIQQRMRRASGGRSFPIGRLLVALAIAAFSVISYCSSQSFNEVTEENQFIGISPEQEIAMGLQATPELAEQFGGLHPDEELQAYVDAICQRIISGSEAGETEWPFECYVLADAETINAFALPGGPIFITVALLQRLETEGQLAGILAHEIGHVVARHSAQRVAKMELTQGLTGAVVIATYDPDRPATQGTAQVAAVIGQLVNMKFGRDDELQSDRLAVEFMADAGYDPRAMIRVMEILAEAGDGNQPPEFFSTHPNPDNRIARIQEAIAAVFPDGVPQDLEP